MVAVPVNDMVSLLKDMTSLPSTHHMHKHSLQYTHGVMAMRQSSLLLLATLVCILVRCVRSCKPGARV